MQHPILSSLAIIVLNTYKYSLETQEARNLYFSSESKTCYARTHTTCERFVFYLYFHFSDSPSNSPSGLRVRVRR